MLHKGFLAMLHETELQVCAQTQKRRGRRGAPYEETAGCMRA
jgi:hypothetical protein